MLSKIAFLTKQETLAIYRIISITCNNLFSLIYLKNIFVLYIHIYIRVRSVCKTPS